MRLTILRDAPGRTVPDAETLALAALGWVLGDAPRAERLLSLTGLTPEELRGGLDDRWVLSAVLDFLAAHEPDLVAAAEALQVEPAVLVGAARELSA